MIPIRFAMDFTDDQIVLNKYYHAYFNLVKSRRELGRIKRKGDGLESHHVLPRCLGGNHDDSNRVLFTHREHFIAHLLLTKFTVGKAKSKMVWSLLHFRKKRTCTGEPSPLTSRQHDHIKRLIREESITGAIRSILKIR